MNEETLWNTSSKLIYVILLFTFNILYIKDKRLNRGAPHQRIILIPRDVDYQIKNLCPRLGLPSNESLARETPVAPKATDYCQCSWLPSKTRGPDPGVKEQHTLVARHRDIILDLSWKPSLLVIIVLESALQASGLEKIQVAESGGSPE